MWSGYQAQRRRKKSECLSCLDSILSVKTFFTVFYYEKCHLNHSECTVSGFYLVYSQCCMAITLSISRTFSSREEAPFSLSYSPLASARQPRSAVRLVDLLVLDVTHRWRQAVCGLLFLAPVTLAKRFQGFPMLHHVSALYFFYG